MDFGVGYFPTHDGMSPGALAHMVEERGQDAVFFAEHTHIPVAGENAWPEAPEGGPLPRKYWHCYDLFVALTAAAAATSTLRVGSGICLVVERDPIITANEVASVDHLSGGRLEFGIGAGWNRQEMRHHGTDPRQRMKLLRERVEAMKVIWAEHEASYAGEFVNFERIWSYPKPAQRPHPPILVGGDGPTVLDRVLAFGDAWFPNYRGDEAMFDRIDELRSRADRPIDVHVMSAPSDPAMFERLERAGVRRANHWLPSGPRSTVERALDQWENAIGQFTGG
jgi:probable F420-dependent oxidoreductase